MISDLDFDHVSEDDKQLEDAKSDSEENLTSDSEDDAFDTDTYPNTVEESTAPLEVFESNSTRQPMADPLTSFEDSSSSMTSPICSPSSRIRSKIQQYAKTKELYRSLADTTISATTPVARPGPFKFSRYHRKGAGSSSSTTTPTVSPTMSNLENSRQVDSADSVSSITSPLCSPATRIRKKMSENNQRLFASSPTSTTTPAASPTMCNLEISHKVISAGSSTSTTTPAASSTMCNLEISQQVNSAISSSSTASCVHQLSVQNDDFEKLRVTKTNKGKTLLIYKNHGYYETKRNCDGSRIYWACINRHSEYNLFIELFDINCYLILEHCCTTMMTDEFITEVLREPFVTQNHSSVPTEFTYREGMQCGRELAQATEHVTYQAIHQHVSNEFHTAARRFPTKFAFKQMLRRSRNKIFRLPPGPANLNFDYDEDFLRKRRNLRIIISLRTKKGRIDIWSSDELIRRAASSWFIVSDGTFFSCPNLLSQHFIIYCNIPSKRVFFPCFFCFMTSEFSFFYSLIYSDSMLIDFR